jgi:hypothetical protein
MSDKDALIYQQNCEEFRSLNGFFWQIPLIMMTLNGGLWYSVASLDLSETAQRGVLWFAVLANLVMVAGLARLRNVMASLLIQIHSYQGTTATGRPRIIQIMFSLLLSAAAIGAAVVSCSPRAHFTRKSAVEAPKKEAVEAAGDAEADARSKPVK